MGIFDFWKKKSVKGIVAAAVVTGALALIGRDIAMFGKLEGDMRPARAFARQLRKLERDPDVKNAVFPEESHGKLKAAIEVAHKTLVAAQHSKVESRELLKHGDTVGAFVSNNKAQHLLAQAQEKLQDAFIAQQKIFHEIGVEDAYRELFAMIQKNIKDLGVDLKADNVKIKATKR